MSRSVQLDYESLREKQARVPECLAPEQELADEFDRNETWLTAFGFGAHSGTGSAGRP